MKDPIQNKRFFLVLVITCFISFSIKAQVKIGGNPAIAVNPNAVLELESSNRGFLLPRLGLTSTTSPFPLTSFTAGILVYDTATTGDITPGFYYSDGTKWVKIAGGNAINPLPGVGWNLTGNAGTDEVQHFLGTLDSKDLIFKTNNIERLRLTKDGWIGIGTDAPNAALHVKGQVIIDSLQAGNPTTDSVLVADGTGRIKAIDANRLVTTIKKSSITVSQSGQPNFSTPALITDPAKIMLFRNGVMINFTVIGQNLISPEVLCRAGDEIKIVQTL
jgi:hypothetical protein